METYNDKVTVGIDFTYKWNNRIALECNLNVTFVDSSIADKPVSCNNFNN